MIKKLIISLLVAISVAFSLSAQKIISQYPTVTADSADLFLVERESTPLNVYRSVTLQSILDQAVAEALEIGDTVEVKVNTENLEILGSLSVKDSITLSSVKLRDNKKGWELTESTSNFVTFQSFDGVGYMNVSNDGF